MNGDVRSRLGPATVAMVGPLVAFEPALLSYLAGVGYTTEFAATAQQAPADVGALDFAAPSLPARAEALMARE